MKLWMGALLLTVSAAVGQHGQETTSASAEKIFIDRGKGIVAFDVLNRSDKAILAWIAELTVTRKIADVPQLQTFIEWTSDLCAVAENLRHCAVPLASGNPEGALIRAEVRVTAIVFEDGTTEGDAKLLAQTSAARHAVFLVSQYWLSSFQHLRSAGPPVEQMEAFRKFLAAPDSAMPSGLALRGDLYPLWVSVGNRLPPRWPA
jgi:hypothetical protein